MATMSLDKQITQYLPLLDSEEKKSLLSVIKSFLKRKESSEAVGRISIEQCNKEIDAAMARVQNGHFYTHEEVEEMSKEW
jgi:predicted transcriptional regulator